MSYTFNKSDRELQVLRHTGNTCMMCDEQAILTIHITKMVVTFSNGLLNLCYTHAYEMVTGSAELLELR